MRMIHTKAKSLPLRALNERSRIFAGLGTDSPVSAHFSGVARWILLTCAGVTYILGLTACQTSRYTLPGPHATPKVVILSGGDVLKFTFPGAPELNQTQKIRTDGKVSLPLIGEVSAAGKEVLQLQNELTAHYRSQLKNSEVLVVVESNVTNVVISGAVGSPGKKTFDRPTTVLHAIMEAGGPNEFGNLRNVRIYRLVDGAQRIQILDISSSISGRQPKPFYVQDGDIIYVPRSVF